MNKKRKYIKNPVIIISVVISGLILTFTIASLIYLPKNDRKHIENETLKIAGWYNTEQDLNNVESISLESKLPDLKFRINGFSFSNIKKGYFYTQDKAKIYINTNSSKPPFICVYSNNKVPLIFNLKDPTKTITFYNQLEKYNKK